jgi:hypothetical protein
MKSRALTAQPTHNIKGAKLTSPGTDTRAGLAEREGFEPSKGF